MTAPTPAASNRRRFTVIDRTIMASAALETLPAPPAGVAGEPDAVLLQACREVVALRRRRDKLFRAGEPIHPEGKHNRPVQRIEAAAVPWLSYICDVRAQTLAGHRARAAVVLAVDASGLLMRANLRDAFGAPLLAALVIDLLGPQRQLGDKDAGDPPGLRSVDLHACRINRQIDTAMPSGLDWERPRSARSPKLPQLRRRYFPGDNRYTKAAAALDAATTPAAIDPNSPDAALETASRAFIELEQRLDRLARRNDGGDGLEQEIGLLERASMALLQEIAAFRASTLAGHRARAKAFLARDSGRLFRLADTRDSFDDRMLAALVVDLLHGP